MAVAMVVAGVTVVMPTVALAELRTATTALQSSPSATTAAFPGLDRVNIRYEESTGDLQLSALLRTPLADAAQTSAARSTYVDVTIGSFYEGSRFGSCLAGDTRSFQMALGEGLVRSDNGAEVPLTVSPDRRSVIATFPASDELRGRNFICAYASIWNRVGDLELARTSLFDGFAGDDGDVGVGASEDLQDEFIYLHNNRVKRSGDQIGRVPGATARCTPARGVNTVSCRAKARIKTLPGAPTITLRGTRRYTITSAKSLRWQQRMRVQVSWRHCPARYGKRLAGRSCQFSLKWPTGTYLTPLVYRTLGVNFTS
jgi:hypothetical protein